MTREQLLRLVEIERRDGLLTADAVVDDATDPSSPLHEAFDWDDRTAARAYRVQQARVMIQSISVRQLSEVTHTVLIKQSAPAYLKDPDTPSNQQGYCSVVELAGDEEKARRALCAEFKRIRSLLTRARQLAQALGCIAKHDDLFQRLELITNELEAPERVQ